MVNSYLLDTCLVSEASKPHQDGRVEIWLRQVPADRIWTSVIVMGELQAGISLLEEGARRRSLVAWLSRLRATFGDRCLGVDEPIANAWGHLHAARQKSGRPLPMADGLICATALVRGLVVVTRDVHDFQDSGVGVLNPWTD